MEKEKVLNVIVEFKNLYSWPVEDVENELEELVTTSGGEVAGSIVCRLDRASAQYLIGAGKVDEIASRVAMEGIDTVIFSHDLKGSQQRNIEEVIKAKTIDRTQLILDIFAKHASTQEGQMQVELAQLEYLLPRLVGKGIELSRLGGGIGTLGPGETKLEVDRRRIGTRIAKLKKDLKGVESNRAVNRKKRHEKGIPTVSLIGYTNAGKSTLLNALTEAEQETEDGLFTTLDSVARQYTLPNHQKIVISDTVGFIHDLPHHLIESFKATLEEVNDADVLLHVLDITHANFRNLHEAVKDVLRELGAINKPVITVLNKIDKIDDRSWLEDLKGNYENAVYISGRIKLNLDQLLLKIQEMLSSLITEINVTIPIKRMDLVNLAHKEGQVLSVKYYNETIRLRANLPAPIAGKFQEFMDSSDESVEEED